MPRPSSFRSEVLAAPERTAIYAAAKNYSIGKARKGMPATSGKTGGEGWQDTSWDFYDIVGEYRYSCDWVGNLLSRAKLYATQDGKRTENAIAVEAMESLFGGTEGQSEMLRMLGIHYTVAGEAYIIGVEEKHGDTWHVVASTEIKRSGENTFRIKGMNLEIQKGDGIVIRVWRSHPRRPWKANAPSRAVLPILAELDKLTQHVAAQIDSRLAGAGLLLVPSEMSFPVMPSSKTSEGGDTSNAPTPQGAQAFVDMLIEVMSTAIGDRKDASALVPVVLQIAGEYLEKVQHLKFWSELDEKAIELRKEAIRRLALGMDMPPEVLTGTADVNHWGAWQIDESAIKAHSEPLLRAITSAIAEGYLRPLLEAEGMTSEEAEGFGIAADTSLLRTRPNRSKEAIELYEHGELSAEAMRRENGFDEEDAPDEKERRNMLLYKVASGSATPDQVEEALRMLGIEIRTTSDQETREARPDPSTSEHPTRTAPNDDVVQTELLAAAEQMVFRALERAGNRLKNRIGRRTGVAAKDYYLLIPEPTVSDVTALLEDAWSCTTWGNLPVDTGELEKVLDRYVRSLITFRKEHDRELLRQNLAELRPKRVLAAV